MSPACEGYDAVAADTGMGVCVSICNVRATWGVRRT